MRCSSTRAASVGDFVGELRQRGGVAFGQLADAASERLRDAVQLALHIGGEGGQPFVVHDERLNLLHGELRVFRGHVSIESLLRILHLLAGSSFVLDEIEAFLQHLVLVRRFGVGVDVGKAGFDGGLCQFAFVGASVGKQTVLAAVFLVEFFQTARDSVALGLKLLDGRLFLSEVARAR